MKFKPEPGHIAAVAGGLSAVGLAAAVVFSSAASADTESEACTPSRVTVMAADGSAVDVHTCVYPAAPEPEPTEPPRTSEPGPNPTDEIPEPEPDPVEPEPDPVEPDPSNGTPPPAGSSPPGGSSQPTSP